MLDTKKYSPATGNGRAEQAGYDGNCDHLNTENSPKDQARLQAELASVRRHLEHRAEANAVVAQWRDELRIRITRSQLRHELIGLGADEHDQLVAEVAEYKRLCAALSWSPAGRRRG